MRHFVVWEVGIHLHVGQNIFISFEEEIDI